MRARGGSHTPILSGPGPIPYTGCATAPSTTRLVFSDACSRRRHARAIGPEVSSKRSEGIPAAAERLREKQCGRRGLDCRRGSFELRQGVGDLFKQRCDNQLRHWGVRGQRRKEADRQRPDVVEAEPGLDVRQAEPGFDVRQAEPGLDVRQAEPGLDVRQPESAGLDVRYVPAEPPDFTSGGPRPKRSFVSTLVVVFSAAASAFSILSSCCTTRSAVEPAGRLRFFGVWRADRPMTFFKALASNN